MNEDEREEHLEALIEQMYGDPIEEEIQRRSVGYDYVETRIFEVKHAHPLGGRWIDPYLDAEFNRVHVPEPLRVVLRPGDAFMGTIGYAEGGWSIIHLGPCYWPMEIDEEGDESEEGWIN